MTAYSEAAQRAGSGFHMNPSPGNIKDGLITDAIKSAGAARKGGTSPVEDVLDYTEPAGGPGLNLVCTPGNDVEATTGQAAAGATLILFTTGLGTPTGNAVCPVIKVATNSDLAGRMADIIDIDTGPIIDGAKTIEQTGRRHPGILHPGGRRRGDPQGRPAEPGRLHPLEAGGQSVTFSDPDQRGMGSAMRAILINAPQDISIEGRPAAGEK